MRRIPTYLGLLVVGLYLVAAAARPDPEPLHPYFTDGGFRIIAHRGGPGLGPESTLPVYQRSVDLGVDVLEMDVRPTADGHLVIHHDDRVDRATDGTGRVDSLTLEQLQSLDAGYRWQAADGSFPWRGKGLRILTIDELFRAFPGVRLLVEIKSDVPAVAESLCGEVRDYGVQDLVVVASFATESLEAFRRACPEVATSASAGEVTRYWLLHVLRLGGLADPDFDVFQVPEDAGWFTLVDDRFVAEAGRRNLPVEVWTVNEREQMERLIDVGVDGIMTDRPDLLLQVLDERDMR